jgi:alkaline phosphatase
MATGVLTANGRLGKDFNNQDLTTIMDVAKSMGKATGVVVTDALSGATPGAFSAHAGYRDNLNEIIPSQMTSGVNLLCAFAESNYTLIADQFKDHGYAYAESLGAVDSTFSSEYALWQLNMYGVDATEPLEVVTPKALEYLSQDPDGFVVMIEQAHIDKYCHSSDANKFENMCKSVSSLNKTVEAVMQWVGDRTDTMVLVTADHETGGLQISEKAGKYSTDVVLGDKTISYEFLGTNHTGVNVALYVYGVTADFTKSSLYSKKALKNIGIYYLMEEALTAGQGTK